MDNERKTRIREKIFGKRLASLLGEGADKFGHYKESYGGGTPLKAGEKAPSKQWVEDNRVMQPRDEDGKFTYNAVNGKELKFPSTRGTTMSPLLKGAKLTFIRAGDKFKFEDGKIVMSVGNVDLSGLLREYTSLGFDDQTELSDELFIKKEGRRSKVEQEAGMGFVGHRDIRQMGETQKQKLIDSYRATGRRIIESMITEDGVNRAFTEFKMTVGGKTTKLPVKSIIEDTKEIDAQGLNKESLTSSISTTIEDVNKGTAKFVRKKKTEKALDVEKKATEEKEETKVEPKLGETEKQTDKETTKAETKAGEPKEEVTEEKVDTKEETKVETKPEPKVETKVETKTEEPKAETTEKADKETVEEPKAEPKEETQEEEKTRVEKLFGGKKAEPIETEQATGEELDKVDELFGGRTERTPKQNVIGIDQLQEDLGIDKIETEEELNEWFKNNYPLIKGTFESSKKVKKIRPMLEQVAQEISKQYNIKDFKGTKVEPYGRMVTPLTLFKYILGNGINSEESLREKLDKDLRGIKNGK